MNFNGSTTHFVAKDIESFSDSLHLLATGAWLLLSGSSLSLSLCLSCSLFVLLRDLLGSVGSLVSRLIEIVALATVSTEEINGSVATRSSVHFDGGTANLVSEDIESFGDSLHVVLGHFYLFFYLNYCILSKIP